MIWIGTNPIAWSNDDDRSLGADISLEQCLTEAASIGFDGIEQGHKMPTSADSLRRALAPHGLRFISGWHSLQLLQRSVEEEIQVITPHLNLLQALGCRVCIVCETTGAIHGDPDARLTTRPVLPDNGWDEFARKIDVVAEHCAARNLRLVYHHHMGTIVQSRDDLEALMSRTGPATGLLLDTGHARLARMDAEEVTHSYAERIAHVHLKNVRSTVMAQVLRDDHSFLQAVRAGVFTVPGDRDGAIDFDPVFQALAAATYEGWLVIEAEQDPAEYPPSKYQRLGYQSVEQMAARAGFERG